MTYPTHAYKSIRISTLKPSHLLLILKKLQKVPSMCQFLSSSPPPFSIRGDGCSRFRLVWNTVTIREKKVQLAGKINKMSLLLLLNVIEND